MNNLEFELISINNLIKTQEKELKLLNERIIDLEAKRQDLFVRMAALSSEELTTSETIQLGKLMKHIITIVKSDEVIGWHISISHDTPHMEHDRGKYSIQISSYTIEEYGYTGLRYFFEFKTRHPKVKEIISNVINEPAHGDKLNKSWSMFLYGPDLELCKCTRKFNEEYLKSLF
jgi:hypothetical protein